jgi:hypothetical protein
VNVDTDLSKFFDTVDHDVLMSRVALKVKDKRFLERKRKLIVNEKKSQVDQADRYSFLVFTFINQWRNTRTKVRNLTRQGCPLDMAISVGMSRKGPWHLSRTNATQLAMSDKWLENRGWYPLNVCGMAFTTRLRPGDRCEPPGADPHAGWCGDWGRKSPGYPIKRC